ncbi:hypothetical protein IW262DRAFT_1487304 [Armillaria fumosa]|nr:hypothetical protein IW262DRAFT_1487304 [Armillaria fumosa]
MARAHPKGASLDLIRIEMLNLGLEYTWLDVLCLRQRGGLREDLHVKEWKLDVPTIGAIYSGADVMCYLSGPGLPLSLKEGDLESDRCWFRRAWTLQELESANQNQMLCNIGNLYGKLSMIHDRLSSNPIDRVAGLAFSLWTAAIPSYYENQSLEGAWTALINEMIPVMRGVLLFTYPEPGTGCKKWRPSWEQVMEKSLPRDNFHWLTYVESDDDDWCEKFHIEKEFVRGLVVGGEEGIDRCGELVVENAHGIAHSFNILAGHQIPVPEDTYTLLGSNPFGWKYGWKDEIRPPQYWVVGRRLPSKMFEKVPVFTMTVFDEIKRLMELGLSAKSRCVLA